MPYKRKDSPIYWATYTDASGKRVRRSTGTAGIREAKWKLEAHQQRSRLPAGEDRGFSDPRPPPHLRGLAGQLGRTAPGSQGPLGACLDHHDREIRPFGPGQCSQRRRRSRPAVTIQSRGNKKGGR